MRKNYYRQRFLDKIKMSFRPNSMLENAVKQRNHYFVPSFVPALQEYMDMYHDDIIREPHILQSLLDFHIPRVPAETIDVVKKTCSEENGFYPGDFTPIYDCIGHEFDMLKQFHIDLAVFLQNADNLFKYEKIYERLLNFNEAEIQIYNYEYQHIAQLGSSNTHLCDTVLDWYSVLDVMKDHVKITYLSPEYRAFRDKQILNDTIHVEPQIKQKHIKRI